MDERFRTPSPIEQDNTVDQPMLSSEEELAPFKKEFQDATIAETENAVIDRQDDEVTQLCIKLAANSASLKIVIFNVRLIFQAAQFRAMYDYDAQEEDEVSFYMDDVIANVRRIDEGWVVGTVQRTNRTGMIPANYIEQCS